MTDKARAEFEYWASDDGYNPAAVERSGHSYKLAQIQTYWQAWLAAKEKYEPRWIDVRKSIPEEDGDVLCLLSETGDVCMAFHFNSFFVNNDVECDLLPVTHWMPVPPSPSTQGEES